MSESKETSISNLPIESLPYKAETLGDDRKVVDVTQVDVAVKLVEGGYEGTISEEDARRIRSVSPCFDLSVCSRRPLGRRLTGI